MISTGSLHSSSGTLLAGSSVNSISEITDIETEDDFQMEPPQVSISSCDSVAELEIEPESCSSISIYESPMSSVYGERVKSKNFGFGAKASSIIQTFCWQNDPNVFLFWCHMIMNAVIAIIYWQHNSSDFLGIVLQVFLFFVFTRINSSTAPI